MNKKGFTLIELIVVIAVLAVLVGISIVVYSVVVDRANSRVCETNLIDIERGYYVQEYLDSSLDKVTYFENIGDYLHDPTCPVGGEYYLTNGVFGCTEHGEVPFADQG